VGICGAMLTSFQQIQSASALMSKPHRLSNISDRYGQGMVAAPIRYLQARACKVWLRRMDQPPPS
jgi:hypothetical protein